MDFYNQYRNILKTFFADQGYTPFWVKTLAISIDILSLTLLCVIVFYITKVIFMRGLRKIAYRFNIPGKEDFEKKKVIAPLAHITPAFVIKAFVPLIFENSPGYISFFLGLTNIYIIIAITIVLGRFVSAIGGGIGKLPLFRDKPVTSYSQLIIVIIWIVALIMTFAILLNQSPIYLLSALGAMTAVLILIFRDTILGFVASIQISAYDMIKPGDWITMPKHDADGDVIAINLNTVKVRNFDRTIVMIPSYSFISESFRNWRGMVDSKGRRIKRSLFINVGSIKFCTKEMIEKFKKYELIRDYIISREEEIEKFNATRKIDKAELLNGRNMTNVGIFRKYIEEYVKSNDNIRKDPGFTLMVRQLEPTDRGLPLEIYAFTTVTDWVIYESIQADIFDHLLSSVGDFGLTLFQNPTGMDIRALKPKDD